MTSHVTGYMYYIVSMQYISVLIYVNSDAFPIERSYIPSVIKELEVRKQLVYIII